jgi:hypothetical protein
LLWSLQKRVSEAFFKVNVAGTWSWQQH